MSRQAVIHVLMVVSAPPLPHLRLTLHTIGLAFHFENVNCSLVVLHDGRVKVQRFDLGV